MAVISSGSLPGGRSQLCSVACVVPGIVLGLDAYTFSTIFILGWMGSLSGAIPTGAVVPCNAGD